MNMEIIGYGITRRILIRNQVIATFHLSVDNTITELFISPVASVLEGLEAKKFVAWYTIKYGGKNLHFNDLLRVENKGVDTETGKAHFKATGKDTSLPAKKPRMTSDQLLNTRNVPSQMDAYSEKEIDQILITLCVPVAKGYARDA